MSSPIIPSGAQGKTSITGSSDSGSQTIYVNSPDVHKEKKKGKMARVRELQLEAKKSTAVAETVAIKIKSFVPGSTSSGQHDQNSDLVFTRDLPNFGQSLIRPKPVENRVSTSGFRDQNNFITLPCLSSSFSSPESEINSSSNNVWDLELAIALSSFEQDEYNKLYKEMLEKKSPTCGIVMTDQILEDVNVTLSLPPTATILEMYSIQVKQIDLKRLTEPMMVDDTVVNVYLGLIEDRNKKWIQEGIPNIPTVRVLSTSFFEFLKSNEPTVAIQCTQDKNILSHDLLLVPVCDDSHWSLIVVNFKAKNILAYDSSQRPKLARTAQNLELMCKFLEDEHKGIMNQTVREGLGHEEQKSTDEGEGQICEVSVPGVNFLNGWEVDSAKNAPKQKNGVDCGIFTTQFAEYVSRNASLDFGQVHTIYFRYLMASELIHGVLYDRLRSSYQDDADTRLDNFNISFQM